MVAGLAGGMAIERTAGRSADGDRQPGPRLTNWSARDAFGAKDLRAVGWLVLERLFIGDFEPGKASAAATVIRALTALGDSPADEEEQNRIITLHGLLMNGFQPRDAEEWELAERVFGPERMAEFRRWRALKGEPSGLIE